jgi:PadR family transcriptional regulator PadR
VRERLDLIPGTLDMLVLKTLVRAPLYGYAIALSIRRVSNDVLAVKEGSLYEALRRLVAQGCITKAWKMTNTNRLACFYSLTRTGRRQLTLKRYRFDRAILAIGRVMNDGKEEE